MNLSNWLKLNCLIIIYESVKVRLTQSMQPSKSHYIIILATLNSVLWRSDCSHSPWQRTTHRPFPLLLAEPVILSGRAAELKHAQPACLLPCVMLLIPLIKVWSRQFSSRHMEKTHQGKFPHQNNKCSQFPSGLIAGIPYATESSHTHLSV